jgi:hypothetical protein
MGPGNATLINQFEDGKHDPGTRKPQILHRSRSSWCWSRSDGCFLERGVSDRVRRSQLVKKSAPLGPGNATLINQFGDGSTTPVLESPKYFIGVVHHSAGVDPMGAIEFGRVSGSKSLQHWVKV